MSASFFNPNETIVALATPPGVGGIGVLRLSGPKAKKILTQLWKPSFASKKLPNPLIPRQLTYGILSHPKTNEVLDQALVVWFPKPHSYTGEEVVEIHAHGAPLLLNQLLELTISLGARLAEPGEFTRRAYLNGKLDLLQAEAVAELIHAKSEAALKNARTQLAGRLSKEVEELRERVIKLRGRVEAAIDFPEEDIELIQAKQTGEALASLQATLQLWQEKFQLGRLLREGVTVALVGRPNVGKSSLLNSLLGETKAIVHASAGTTRDVVEGWISLNGVGFEFWDTAGMRESQGEVEQLGIERSRERTQRADIRLWVIDASQDWTLEDEAMAAELLQIQGATLVAANKSDLKTRLSGLPKEWFDKFSAKNSLAKKASHLPWISISAQGGVGLEELKTALQQVSGLEALGEQTHAYLNNTRHRLALEKAQAALARAQEALTENLPAECVAADLKEASEALGTLLGKISTEDILDKIFQEFCLGK